MSDAATVNLPDVADRHPFSSNLLDIYRIMSAIGYVSNPSEDQDSIPRTVLPWPAGLSTPDRESLQAMALSSGLERGPAVYVARALLNQVALPTAPAIPVAPVPDGKAGAEDTFTLWPNPANDRLMIHSTVDCSEVLVFAHDGRIQARLMANGKRTLSLHTGTWVPGLYRVLWLVNGQLLSSRSFVIARP
jgi:hypothetical protein